MDHPQHSPFHVSLCFLSHKLSRKTVRFSLCSGGRRSHPFNSRFCISVSLIFSPPSSKNCDTVIPKAMQIFSRDPTDGTRFLLYQVDMDDCEIPEASANRYSLHPRSARSWLIRLNTSINKPSNTLIFNAMILSQFELSSA